MLTTCELLSKTLEMIRHPDTWTAEAFARTEMGAGVTWIDPKASAWCAFGALCNAGFGFDGKYFTPEYYEAKKILLELTDGVDLIIWNDSHSHKDVIALFEKAIEVASK